MLRLLVENKKHFCPLGIRSSIEKRSDGAITDNDILSVLPWGNKLYMVPMTGSTIRRALEHGAALRGKDSDGGFLQVSGIRVVFNSNELEGRIIFINASSTLMGSAALLLISSLLIKIIA